MTARRFLPRLAIVVAMSLGAGLAVSVADVAPAAAQRDASSQNSTEANTGQTVESALAQIVEWEKRLQSYETKLSENRLDTPGELRQTLDRLTEAATAVASAEPLIREELSQLSEQLDALSAGPAESSSDETAEEGGAEGAQDSGDVSADSPGEQVLRREKAQLQSRADRLEGALKRISLLETRIEQLQSRVLDLLRARATSRYLAEFPLPVLPSTLQGASEEIAQLGGVVWRGFVNSARNFDRWQVWSLSAVLAGLALSMLMAHVGVFSILLLRKFAPRHAGPESSHSLILQIIMRIVLPGAIAFGLGRYAATQLFVLGAAHELTLAATQSFWRYVAAYGLLHVILQTGHQGEGNLIGMEPENARRVFFGANLLLVVAHVVYAAFLFDQSTPIPENLASVGGGILAILLAVIVAHVAHAALPGPAQLEDDEEDGREGQDAKKYVEPDPEARDSGTTAEAAAEEEDDPASSTAYHAGVIASQLARFGIFAISTGGVVAALLGYTVMSLETMVNLVFIGILAALLSVLHASVLRLSRLMAESRAARNLRRRMALPPSFRATVSSWLHNLFVLALILLAIIGALILIGVPREVIHQQAVRLLTGVQIGNIEISLTEIFVGIGVFLAAVILTRWIQTLVSSRLFRRSQLDAGIQNSISTFIGYAGFALAALLAVGSFGLDLSNLAVIAGALSVGIGFGLQAIVNNFVSGIILLVERPIKIGDWVELDGEHGIVKRINVRSTEVETFQQQSIIVPNSELISRSVTNYTHKNRHGRIDIKIGVRHDTDIDKLSRILLEIGRNNRHVMQKPGPYIHFPSIGESALHVELRVYMRNILDYLEMITQLNTEICRALKENGIEFAYPQRTLHVADLPEVSLQSPSALDRPEPAREKSERDSAPRAPTPARRSDAPTGDAPTGDAGDPD